MLGNIASRRVVPFRRALLSWVLFSTAVVGVEVVVEGSHV